MHPDRLSFLAFRHAPARDVVSMDVRTDGTPFVLSCGHNSFMVSHFDATAVKAWPCYHCGIEVVKGLTQYASEF